MKDSQGNNCCLLGTGENAADHAHVTRQTPMQTKRKEIQNDPQYQSAAMDKGREKSVTAARRGGNVRPLDGGVAS
jgi:hypothetical protein